MAEKIDDKGHSTVEEAQLAAKFLPPLNLRGLRIPDLSENELKVRSINPNLDEFLTFADPRGDKMPEFLMMKGPESLNILDREVLTYAYAKLYGSRTDDEIMTEFQIAIGSPSFPDFEAGNGTKFVIREFIAKVNRLRMLAIQDWINHGDVISLNSIAALEYTDLTPAIAAADQYFIKVSNGCFDTDEEMEIISRAYGKLLADLESDLQFELACNPRDEAEISAFNSKIDYYREFLKRKKRKDATLEGESYVEMIENISATKPDIDFLQMKPIALEHIHIHSMEGPFSTIIIGLKAGGGNMSKTHFLAGGETTGLTASLDEIQARLKALRKLRRDLKSLSKVRSDTSAGVEETIEG